MIVGLWEWITPCFVSIIVTLVDYSGLGLSAYYLVFPSLGLFQLFVLSCLLACLLAYCSYLVLVSTLGELLFLVELLLFRCVVKVFVIIPQQ